jgi:hypothetical protein
VKVASGSASKRSDSSSSSFFGATLIAAASAAMCRPCFSRASRSSRPAEIALAGAAAPGSSLIERAAGERRRLPRLGEAIAQLPTEVGGARPVAELVLDAAASHSVWAFETCGRALTRRM